MPLFKVSYSELRMVRTTYYVEAPDRHAAESHGQDEEAFDELLRTHAPLTIDREYASPEYWQEVQEVRPSHLSGRLPPPDFIIEPVDEYEYRIAARKVVDRVRRIVETETSLCLDDETDRERLIQQLVAELSKS